MRLFVLEMDKRDYFLATVIDRTRISTGVDVLPVRSRSLAV